MKDDSGDVAKDQSAAFLAWNNALAVRFFNPDMADRRVFIYTTEDVVSKVARDLQSTRAELLEVVQKGPSWAVGTGLCHRAASTLDNWRERELQYPPYLAQLCVFVLAAGLEGDFKPWAYYPRLRALLDMPGEGALPGFKKIDALWDDLEVWASRDQRGDLGIFHVSFAGEMIHVALPKAQTVLTERERQILPLIFAEAGLDPSMPPPAGQLARTLRERGSGLLRSRTLQLLSRPQTDRELHDSLVETASEELSEWDGEVPNPDNGQETGQVHGLLRLTLRYDKLSAAANVNIRCRARRPIPEAGFDLATPDARLYGEEVVPGWSSALAYEDGQVLNGADITWEDGLTASDEQLRWTFRLPAAQLRVFISGQDQGLPDFIETDHLPEGREFYVAFSEPVASRVLDWGERDCSGFHETTVLSGLPTRWRLAHANVCHRSGDLPALTLPDRLRIYLRAGIRVSPRRPVYFPFAQPEVEVAGAKQGVLPTWGDTALQQLANGNYALPENLPLNDQISIEVGDDPQRKKVSLYLAVDYAWRIKTPTAVVDRWGLAASSHADGQLAGALTETAYPEEEKERNPLLAAAGSLHTQRRWYLVGQHPGQIHAWPQEPVPDAWTATWLVPLERRGTAIFCGGDLENCDPDPRHRGDRAAVKNWKQLLWYWRKRIEPPRGAALRKLWRKYQQVAHDV